MATPDDADAVMFALQDLPCVGQIDVDLARRQVTVEHTAMMAPEDLAAALGAAGYEAHEPTG